MARARFWVAGRVNRRWPLLASLIILGPEAWLADVAGTMNARAEVPEPEEVPSRGKVGSRPEDLGGNESWDGGREGSAADRGRLP